MSEQPIGIFDSGVGGLKILAALRKVLPRENYIYVFDRSHSPYGNRSNRYIKKRAEKVSEMLIKEGGENGGRCVQHRHQRGNNPSSGKVRRAFRGGGAALKACRRRAQRG